MEETLKNNNEEHRQMLLKECKEKLKEHGELIPRELKIQNETVDSSSSVSGQSFRVQQWNILADALAASTPDSNFNKVPAGCLDWSFRKHRVIEHILTVNADVVCLEEVDHFSDWLEPAFKSVGFQGVFQPKKDSPCLRIPNNNGPDGVCIFYRSDRFDCKHVVKSFLKGTKGEESNQPTILCCLEDKLNRKSLVVAVVHLKAKPGFEELRQIQSEDAVSKILDILKERNLMLSPVLLMGDFNGDDSEPFYNSLEKFKDLNIASAYKKQLGQEVAFTTWKFRDSKEYKRTIDYIWYSVESLIPFSYLDLPNQKNVPEFRFPAWSFPSDHMSLCCDFEYL